MTAETRERKEHPMDVTYETFEQEVIERSHELPEVVAALEQGDDERALELLLAEIGAAEDGNRERLLRLTVALFADLGHEHPLTLRYRRQLAAQLY